MKKLLSLLLAAVMLLTAVSGMTFTANAEEINLNTYIAQVQGTSAITTEPEVKFTQTKINYLDQTITISNADALIDEGVTTAKVTVSMNYKGTVTQTKSSVITLEKGKTDYSFTYPTYGKFNAEIEFKKGDTAVCTVSSPVGIIAEEYNLAPLNASFPVAYFSLAIQDASTNDNDEPVPGFVFLERDDAFDWDALAENVYALPYATEAQLHDGRQYFHQLQSIMADFVKDLFEISPKAKFNLYTVDNYCENMLMILNANNIPEEQYHVYLLSDGAGSYSIFNDTYNTTNASSVYSDMAAEWKRVKNLVETKHQFTNDMLEKYLDEGGHDYQIFRRYAYVIAKEESNVEWWLARVNDTLQIPDAEFLAEVKAQAGDPNGCIKVKSMNAMLNDLKSKGEASVNAFKKMYKFNNSMFSEAQKQNKKVMLILGTLIDLEENFEDYVKFVKAYYGDNYIYYYKGHPATPTALSAAKTAQLSKLNLTDVESSVPAELIMFFNPDIYLCGYQSSTFLSVTNDDKACALFNANKSVTDAYAKSMDSFVSKIDLQNDYYKAYSDYCTDSSKTYYLVEYNNTDKYCSSIFNATDGTMVNLKETGINAVYNYSVIDRNMLLQKGEGSFVTLPKLESTSRKTFEGWSDGTRIYPGDITLMISTDTTFTAVWTKVPETILDSNVTLSTTTYTYNGKVKKPSVTVKDSNGNKVDAANYTVTYASGRKNVGSYTVKIKFSGDYAGIVTKTFKIVPGSTSVSSIKGASKKFTVKWKKKTSGTTGYQIQYATNSKFSKAKTVTVTKNSTTSKTVSKLSAKKKYYVRVRTYKTVKVNGKSTKYYSSWSKAKTVTTKK